MNISTSRIQFASYASERRPTCFIMDQASPSHSSAPGLLEPDSGELQLRVDTFRKLGYSTEEVTSALRKLGLATDTNAVLGELVRSRSSNPPCLSSSDSDERRAGLTESLLPPSWVPSPRAAPQMGNQKNTETELRPVVIDGSNVAMSHGNKEVFSCRGIQLAVSFFLDRGHSTITVFVPTWRKEQPRPDAPITGQHILTELEKRKIVVFTPSRRVGGKRVVCYDDRFIIKLAYESDGVIVSNDTYRDLQGERPEWKKCIEERLLMYSFVNDKFMPPDDPLGRHGPSLDNFLRKKPLPAEQKRQLCPYDKKCTYGIKCKFYHPERASQSYLSLADELREKAQISTAKEEKNARLSPRQVQPDAESARNAELVRDWQISSQPTHMSENQLFYWEDFRNSSNQIHCSIPAGQCQKDWPSLPSVPNQYYASTCHEYLDSGFGSFESQYSDNSHCLSNSHRLRSQQQTGPRHNSAHFGKKDSRHPYRSCSPAEHSTALQQQLGKLDANCQLNYSQMFPPSVPHQHSLPSHLHYSGTPHPQQNNWSEPYQLGVHQARTSPRLPSSRSHNSCCTYKRQEYQSWGQQQPAAAVFDPQRMELRKKLHAIFNPHQVDTVMEMFPHVTDAEKLAAEILNMKAQTGIF